MKMLRKYLVGILVIAGCIVSVAWGIGPQIATSPGAEQEKARLEAFHRIWEGVWHKPEETERVISNVFTDDFLYHVAPLAEPVDKPTFIQFVAGWQKAFPDDRMEILDLAVEGNKVWCYWVSTGTHSDVYVDIPATGMFISYKGVDILRFTEDAMSPKLGRYLIFRLWFIS